MTTHTHPGRNAANDEIDLLLLTKKIWLRRKTIVRCMIAGAMLSLLVALLSPKKFTVTAIIVPQTEKDNLAALGGLSSIATMAGIDLKSMNQPETLPPLVYPSLIRSLPFQLELMNTQFNCPGFTAPATLADYLIREQHKGIAALAYRYTIGLPRTLAGKDASQAPTVSFAGKTLQAVTRDQEEVREKLKKIIRLEQNEEEGYLELKVTMKDPVLTAQVAQKALSLLQETISRYKLEKANQKLQFTQARFSEKKNEFEQARRELAVFRNRNKSLTTAILQTELEQLQSDYQLAYSVYTELAKQLEQAQIQVKEDTPVLTVIDPVHIPTKKSAPKNLLHLIAGLFLGTLAGIAVVVVGGYSRPIKDQWIQL